MPVVLSPTREDAKLNWEGGEDHSAGPPFLSMPFRLSSWEITYYSTRDFTLPPMPSKFGRGEGSSPLSGALCWIKRQSRRECGPRRPGFLSGVMEKYP